MRSMAGEITSGDGYSVGHLDDLGDGPGFRKIRPELDVTEFGVNAIVLPAGIETGFHMHERQQELYFVHSRRDRDRVRRRRDARARRRAASPGSTPSTVRKIRNRGDRATPSTWSIGAEGGYVGRDGQLPDGETAGGRRPIGRPRE